MGNGSILTPFIHCSKKEPKQDQKYNMQSLLMLWQSGELDQLRVSAHLQIRFKSHDFPSLLHNRFGLFIHKVISSHLYLLYKQINKYLLILIYLLDIYVIN
jgi:hypothetical protein